VLTLSVVVLLARSSLRLAKYYMTMPPLMLCSVSFVRSLYSHQLPACTQAGAYKSRPSIRQQHLFTKILLCSMVANAIACIPGVTHSLLFTALYPHAISLLATDDEHTGEAHLPSRAA
jgi:uncharacterized membrane protein